MKLKFPKDMVGIEKERDTLALICPPTGYPDQMPCIIGTHAAMAQLCKEFSGPK